MTPMTPLERIQAINADSEADRTVMAPLYKSIAAKEAELVKMRSTLAATHAALAVAVQQDGLVSGRYLVGDATATEAAEARKAREGARKAHHDALIVAEGGEALEQEIAGLREAGKASEARLAGFQVAKNAAIREHLLAQADAEAGVYRSLADLLIASAARLAAWNEVMGSALVPKPEILTPFFWNLAIPGINLPSAYTSSGALADMAQARKQQPAALADIRRQLSADGVVV